MFDRIAGLYDRMNTVMTAGLHHRWRRRTADLTAVPVGGRARGPGFGRPGLLGAGFGRARPEDWLRRLELPLSTAGRCRCNQASR